MRAADLLLDCRNTHGEGVLWDERSRRVWWTDIHGKKHLVLRSRVARSPASFDVPARVCCFAPRARGGLAGRVRRGVRALRPRHPASARDLARFEPDLPGTRLNDGRTDRAGRFVAGGMDEANGQPGLLGLAGRRRPLRDAPLRRRHLRQRDLLLARRPDHVLRRLPPAHARGHRLRPGHRRRGRAPRPGERSTGPACPTAPAPTPRASSGWPSGRATASSAGRRTAASTGPSSSRSGSRPAAPSAARTWTSSTSPPRGSAPARRSCAREPTSGSLYAFRPGVRGLARHPLRGLRPAKSEATHATRRNRMKRISKALVSGTVLTISGTAAAADYPAPVAAQAGRAGGHLEAEAGQGRDHRLHAAGHGVQLLHRDRRGHQGRGGQERDQDVHARPAVRRRHQRPDGHDPGRHHTQGERDHPLHPRRAGGRAAGEAGGRRAASRW